MMKKKYHGSWKNSTYQKFTEPQNETQAHPTILGPLTVGHVDFSLDLLTTEAKLGLLGGENISFTIGRAASYRRAYEERIQGFLPFILLM